MSTISSVHTVVDFDAKKSQALTDQRLARVIYKTPKKGVKKQSKCVSIPVVSVVSADFISGATAYIANMYQAAQDGIIRELVEKGKTEVQDSEINDTSVLQYLADEAAGNRLTKETVSEWFTGNVADMLSVAFADKLGVSDTPTPEQEAIVAQSVATYKDKFVGLAGGKTKYDKETAVKLLKALEVVEVNDDIGVKFTARLTAMRDAPTGADMFGL